MPQSPAKPVFVPDGPPKFTADAPPERPAVDPELARASARAAATAGGGMAIPLDIPWRDQVEGIKGDAMIGASLIPFGRAVTAPGIGAKLLGVGSALKDAAIPAAIGTGAYHLAKTFGASDSLAGELSGIAGFAGGGRGLIRKLLTRPAEAAAEGELSAAGRAAMSAGRTDTGFPPRAIGPPTPSPKTGSVIAPERVPLRVSGSGTPTIGPITPSPTSMAVPKSGAATSLQRAEMAEKFRSATTERVMKNAVEQMSRPKPRLTPTQSVQVSKLLGEGMTFDQAVKIATAVSGAIKGGS